MTNDVAGNRAATLHAWRVDHAHRTLHASSAAAVVPAGPRFAAVRELHQDVADELEAEHGRLALLEGQTGSFVDGRLVAVAEAAMRAMADGRIDDARDLIEHAIRLRDQLRRATEPTAATRTP